MNNTYGLHSINCTTFNVVTLFDECNYGDNDFGFPNIERNYKPYLETDRNRLVTFLKVHNLTLDILGYIPVISNISGGVRIGTGLLLLVFTLVNGKNKENNRLFNDRRYKEAIETGICQIFRGVMEALFPYGKVINLGLATLATFEFLNMPIPGQDSNSKRYPEPEYPFPLSRVLNLV